jgi:hypothetical protein
MDAKFYQEQGQNIPVAAAFAVKADGDVLDLNVSEIRHELQKQGIPDHN